MKVVCIFSGGEEIIEVIVKLARKEIQLIGLIEEGIEKSFRERKIKGSSLLL